MSTAEMTAPAILPPSKRMAQYSSISTTFPVADLADGSNSGAWAPSPQIVFPSLPPGLTLQAALRFSVPQSSGSWGIDDVFIDPWGRW